MWKSKPYLVMTHDETGMFLWMTTSLPKKSGARYVCSDRYASKMRIPVSWFGGMLEKGRSTIRDIEETFGDVDVSAPLLIADRCEQKLEKKSETPRVRRASRKGICELMGKIKGEIAI